MTTSRIQLKSSVAFEDQNPKKISEITEEFLKKSAKNLNLIKIDLENFFGLNTIKLFKDDPIIKQVFELDDLILGANAFIDSNDPYNTYYVATKSESETIVKIVSGLNKLYLTLKERIQRIEQARIVEAELFPNYKYPNSYFRLEKKADTNLIEKAVAIFEDYKRHPKLRFHNRSHIKPAEYLAVELIRIASSIKPQEEFKKDAVHLIELVKNNLIARGFLVVKDENVNSSFLRRMHFATDHILKTEAQLEPAVAHHRIM